MEDIFAVITYTQLTNGHTHVLLRVIVNVAMVTGLKSNILGYISTGERVCNKKLFEKIRFVKNNY